MIRILVLTYFSEERIYFTIYLWLSAEKKKNMFGQ